MLWQIWVLPGPRRPIAGSLEETTHPAALPHLPQNHKLGYRDAGAARRSRPPKRRRPPGNRKGTKTLTAARSTQSRHWRVLLVKSPAGFRERFRIKFSTYREQDFRRDLVPSMLGCRQITMANSNPASRIGLRHIESSQAPTLL